MVPTRLGELKTQRLAKIQHSLSLHLFMGCLSNGMFQCLLGTRKMVR